MDHGRHNGHMKLIVHVQGKVVEELLPPLVMGLASGVGLVLASTLGGGVLHFGSDVVVLGESRRNNLGVNSHVLCHLFPRLVVLHQPTAHVMLAVPSDLFGGLPIQDQSEGPLALPHATGDVVTTPQLIGEPLPVLVKQNAAHTSQGLSSQKFDLGVRFLRMNQASGVHLHPLQVHGVPTHRHGHLDPIPRGVLAVRRREMRQVGPVLLQQRSLREISPEAARGQDHGAVCLPLLAVRRLVLHADY
mmetsp:Transcript_50774/g.115421  ORF Transcript_50774/g.115421 Transcript_50774/m.115421 type:complete len:246 (-) Transcript_50774:576-1313(-)